MHLYMGLIHFPVYNKNYDRIASAVTTLDIHDLARLAKTYDVKRLFIVTPLDDQQNLARRVLSHWIEGYGGQYNPHRKEALELVCVVPDLEGAVEEIRETEEEAPLIIATDASDQKDRSMSYEKARSSIQEGKAVILLFGTAWGLHEEVMKKADNILYPVSGKTEYNHLSVRTAAAIILDRLAGEK